MNNNNNNNNNNQNNNNSNPYANLYNNNQDNQDPNHLMQNIQSNNMDKTRQQQSEYYNNNTNKLDKEMYEKLNSNNPYNPYNSYQNGTNIPRDTIPVGPTFPANTPPPQTLVKIPVPVISYIKCYKISVAMGVILLVVGLLSLFLFSTTIYFSQHNYPNNTYSLLAPTITIVLLMFGLSIYFCIWTMIKWAPHFNLAWTILLPILTLYFVSGIIILSKVCSLKSTKPELFKPGVMIIHYKEVR